MKFRFCVVCVSVVLAAQCAPDNKRPPMVSDAGEDLTATDGTSRDKAGPPVDAPATPSDKNDAKTFSDTTPADAGTNPTDSGRDSESPDGEDEEEPAPDAAFEVGPPPPPPPACTSHPNAILCENFEGSTPIPAGWIKDTDGDPGEADIGIIPRTQAPDVPMIDGDKVLRVTIKGGTAAPGDGAGAVIKNTAKFPIPGNHFFGRYYFYNPQNLSAAGHVHDSSISFGGTATYRGTPGQAGFGFHGATQFGLRYGHPFVKENFNVHGGLIVREKEPMHLRQWMCIEWELDGSKDLYKFWVNGKQSQALTVDGGAIHWNMKDGAAHGKYFEWPMPNISEFRFGWKAIQRNPPNLPTVVYFDALVISTERVGCGM